MQSLVNEFYFLNQNQSVFGLMCMLYHTIRHLNMCVRTYIVNVQSRLIDGCVSLPNDVVIMPCATFNNCFPFLDRCVTHHYASDGDSQQLWMIPFASILTNQANQGMKWLRLIGEERAWVGQVERSSSPRDRRGGSESVSILSPAQGGCQSSLPHLPFTRWKIKLTLLFGDLVV